MSKVEKILNPEFFSSLPSFDQESAHTPDTPH